MAIDENGGVDLRISEGSSIVNLESGDADSSVGTEQDQSKQSEAQIRMIEHSQKNNLTILRPHNQSLYAIVQKFEEKPDVDSDVLIVGNHASLMNSVSHISSQNLIQGDLSPEEIQGLSDDGDALENDDAVENYNREMRDLEELFSKLNPLAKEFVPSSISSCSSYSRFFTNGSILLDGVKNGEMRRKKSIYGPGKRKINSRTSMAQREEIICRTVYVSDIDHQVTEEQLAALFISCGQVVDCRVCGDPNSVLRFAFVEFTDEEGARASLNLSGTMLGYYPVKVLPSKTAIAPVNPTFLPRNEDEREMCARTIYCTNIDKKVTQADVKLFFESVCGKVNRLRLLGDYHHSTRISFVEFVMAESAIAALNCSGVVLGALPIRVSPSKTPVRPRVSRLPVH